LQKDHTVYLRDATLLPGIRVIGARIGDAVAILARGGKRQVPRGCLLAARRTIPYGFNPARWIWGHTTSHLGECFKGFGWKLEYFEMVEGAVGPHFDYPLLRFVPA
jgi:hypothetical protein